MTAVRSAPSRVGSAVVQVLLILFALLMLAPVLWAVMSALKRPELIVSQPLSFLPGDFTVDNLVGAFRDVPILSGFANTAIVILVKGGLTMLLCPLAGYAFAKFRFRFKSVLFGTVLLTLMLPQIVLIIPQLIEMQQLGWVNTYMGLILPGAIDAFAIFWMRQVIEPVPDELLDAARIDGCGEFAIYWRIVLPVIRPGLAALALLTIMGIYNDFVWPVIITDSPNLETLQVILSGLASRVSGANLGADFATVWGELLAASAIAMLPLVVAFIALQRQFIRGILAGSMKG